MKYDTIKIKNEVIRRCGLANQEAYYDLMLDCGNSFLFQTFAYHEAKKLQQNIEFWHWYKAEFEKQAQGFLITTASENRYKNDLLNELKGYCIDYEVEANFCLNFKPIKNPPHETAI